MASSHITSWQIDWETIETVTDFISLGLPWWFSVRESAFKFSIHRFDPESGKIPRVMEQRSPCVTWATEPVF